MRKNRQTAKYHIKSYIIAGSLAGAISMALVLPVPVMAAQQSLASVTGQAQIQPMGDGSGKYMMKSDGFYCLDVNGAGSTQAEIHYFQDYEIDGTVFDGYYYHDTDGKFKACSPHMEHLKGVAVFGDKTDEEADTQNAQEAEKFDGYYFVNNLGRLSAAPQVRYIDNLAIDGITLNGYYYFDENGRLTVSGVTGLESNCSGLIRSIGRFEFYDPLAARLNNSYRRSGLEFSGPKNMTIKFRCQPTQLGSWNEEKPRNAYAYDNYDYQSGHGFITVVAYVSMAVLVAALLIPFIPGMEVVKMKIFSWSLEPLCVIGVGWLLLFLNMEIPLGIVRSFMAGTLQAELAKAGFLPFMANALAVAANFLFWVVIYGMFYWGVTNLRSFFSLGPWRYFKERTWVGKFLCFCKHWVCTGLDLFSQTDWESRSSKIIGKAVLANFVILACISLLWFWGIGALILYSIALFFLLKKYWGKVQEKYHRLLNCIQEMAEGNLDVKEEEDLGIFEPFKNQLFKVQEGFKKAVEKEVKSERTKTELITNVSHDLKTPLTAIITYVNLLKQENITEEERNSYIQILDQKSMRLKELIEDLFEVSKAANGTVVLHPEEVDVVSLLKQVHFELSDKIEASGIQFHFDLPNERLAASLDGQKTCRIFENLLVNITKYGMKGTRAYIKAEKDGEYVQVTLRNISAEELKISPEELTERFVRGDASRNTEGSGLGLAIARSFTEVQGGTMKIEVEGDLFRVILRWKLKDGSEEPEETIQEGSVQEKLVQEEPEADDLDTSDQ